MCDVPRVAMRVRVMSARPDVETAAYGSLAWMIGDDMTRKVRRELEDLGRLTTFGPQRALRLLLLFEAVATCAIDANKPWRK